MKSSNHHDSCQANDLEAIRRALGLYCRALDRLDVELLKSVYHSDGVDDHGPYAANAHEFAETIINVVRDLTIYGFHTLTHSVIDVKGSVAMAESYYYGYHVIASDTEKIERFFGPSYVEQQRSAGTLNQTHEHIAAGRYLDLFEKRDEEWKISRRRITNEWGQSQPTKVCRSEGEPGRFHLPGARDRTDPVYELAAKFSALS